ncbi:MAG: diguanylate cyclase domain-containing protein [Eubacteriales bacterium]
MSFIISAAQVNLFSILVLGIIFIYSIYKRYTFSVQNKIYMTLLVAAVFSLIFDFFGRLNGVPGEIPFLINNICNFMVLLSASAVPSLWFMYVYNFVLKPKKQNRQIVVSLIFINIVYILTITAAQSRGLLFTIDQDNFYHRGPLYGISFITAGFIVLIAQAMIVLNRSKMNGKHYYTLLFFAVPPFVSIIIQIFIPGFAFVQNAAAFSLFTVFLFTQDMTINLDYLTEVYNRRYLDLILKNKIDLAKNKKSFSAVMADLDNFKQINDTYGHEAGDDVLCKTAQLLQQCVGKKGIVTRYGGDEFFILLDAGTESELQQIVKTIDDIFVKYNTDSGLPYSVTLSIGCAVFDTAARMSSREFKNHLDNLMYKSKLIKADKKVICN